MVPLTHLVERPDTPAGRAFALTIQTLIIITLVSFSLETLPDLSAGQRRALAALEVVTVTVFSSLWWAVITLTTVGYGDIYPVTAGGRAFTAVVLLVGLGVVAVPTGILSSALSQARAIEREEKKEREQQPKTEP